MRFNRHRLLTNDRLVIYASVSFETDGDQPKRWQQVGTADWTDDGAIQLNFDIYPTNAIEIQLRSPEETALSTDADVAGP